MPAEREDSVAAGTQPLHFSYKSTFPQISLWVVTFKGMATLLRIVFLCDVYDGVSHHDCVSV